MHRRLRRWRQWFTNWIQGLERLEGQSDAQVVILVLAACLGIFLLPGTIWGMQYIGANIGAGLLTIFWLGITIGSVVYFFGGRVVHFLFWWIMIGNYIVPFVMSWELGGFLNSGGAILWLFMTPFGILLYDDPKRSIPWFIGVFVGLMWSLWLAADDSTPLLPRPIMLILLGYHFTIIFGFLFFILVYFLQDRAKAYQLLAEERQKSELLLRNILPEEVADLLKSQTGTVADYFEEVTVLFADISGFTSLSAQVSPQALVRLLNEIFSEFDRLADKYGVEKIKTIGDCYMVAAGVPQPQADHAVILARMALEMQALVAAQKFQGQKLELRIGLHSGPLVAGVIGQKKFAYDLWGDTVNVASRMESQGEAGMIQVTADTYQLLASDFELAEQGRRMVKGRGEMDVYYLIGEKG
ncbi:MAG TPA: adenylate/guanylate cyclase domain-containing protein [Anaerolineae bacterium]|nr:adenylate/guanylate cyclase domain-containing protein [Anaerolineae bacterium]